MLGPTEAWMDELQRTGDPERAAQLKFELGRDLEELETWLERGWQWCERNKAQLGTHEYGVREDRWLERLKLYERVFVAIDATCERAA